ncbi:MAG: hypothetical protein N2442_13645 [Spirochaetes bacterium]|nr:hypothetical protein [Spirochaetota bacterium]
MKPRRRFVLQILMIVLSVFLSSCWFGSSGGGNDTVRGTLQLRSVGAENTLPASFVVHTQKLELSQYPWYKEGSLWFSETSAPAPQVTENAGPAESMTVRLLGVSFLMQGGAEVKVLDPLRSDPVTITLTGDGSAAREFNFEIPTGTIEKVKLLFHPLVRIKGKIENKFYNVPGLIEGQSISVQTHGPYYFNANTGKMMDSNGTLDNPADDTEASNPPPYSYYQYNPPVQGANPETILLWLGNASDSFVVETPIRTTVQVGTAPRINIAADLSRMLRFSVRGSEFWPEDTTVQGWQMFVSNHYMNYLFASFVGGSGTIQGYEYTYLPAGSGEGDFDVPWAKRGWMTLVYDQTGALAFGTMIPDGQPGSPEGYLSEYTGRDAAVSFKVSKDAQYSVTLRNFERKTQKEETVIADLEAPPFDPNNPSSIVNGQVRFVLKMQSVASN